MRFKIIGISALLSFLIQGQPTLAQTGPDDGDEDCDWNTYFADNDGDGFGDAESGEFSCDPVAPEGFVSDSSDCDDWDSAVFPEAVEVCNGIDDDCGGAVDEGFDADYDGTPDCMDDDVSVDHVHDEDCDDDGISNETDNCALVANDDQADFDGDGHGDVCDGDDDGDGIEDVEDDFPLDEDADLGDNADDGIGITDDEETADIAEDEDYDGENAEAADEIPDEGELDDENEDGQGFDANADENDVASGSPEDGDDTTAADIAEALDATDASSGCGCTLTRRHPFASTNPIYGLSLFTLVVLLKKRIEISS